MSDTNMILHVFFQERSPALRDNIKLLVDMGFSVSYHYSIIIIKYP